MVDIQSPMAEIRRGKKEGETTGQKYSVRICYAGRPTAITSFLQASCPSCHPHKDMCVKILQHNIVTRCEMNACFICCLNTAITVLLGSKLAFSRIIDSPLQRVLMMFTRSGRQKWTDLDEIWHTLSTLFEADSDRFWEKFCQLNNARLYRFPVGHISWNLNTTRRSVRRWIFSKQNFEYFPVRGRFS